MRKCKCEYQEKRDANVIEDGLRFPFSSSRKRMTTEVKDVGNGKGNVLCIKGASEIILTSCDKMHYWEGNEIVPLTEELKTDIKAAIKNMAKK